MLTGSTVPTTLHDETDEDLLCWMSMRKDEPKQAEEAWAEFYDRHVGYLSGVCMRLRAYGLRQDDVLDLVQNTFLRVFEKAGSFRPAPEGRSPDKDRAWVRAWLGKIAYRLLVDGYRRSPRLVLVKNADLDAKEAQVFEDQSSPPSPRLQLIREALSQLTDREREIMLVSYAWYEPGKQLTIPDEDLKMLAAQYATTPVNLRQIRARAKKKIEDHIAKHERQS